MTDTVFNRLRTDTIAYANAVAPDLADRIVAVLDDLDHPSQGAPKSAKQLPRSKIGWDRDRVGLIHSAAKQLASLDVENLLAPECLSHTELPFYEAYFSKYIEGTEFTLPEARALVKANKPPDGREADGHDALGTLLCAAGASHAQVGATPEETIALMKMRHKTVMRGRPERLPGEWKQKGNQAGSTVFVEPELVQGTLLKSLEPLNDLGPGFARSVFVMFAVAEVHPFVDGNGRTARLMMNAELSAANLRRNVVPTIERQSYLQTLKRASRHNGDIAGLVRVLANSWAWTCSIRWDNAGAAAAQVEATNALMSPLDADDAGVSLIIA